MAAPIPSFFKIRCWLVIIAFLLFFMFLGAVKRGVAAATCQQIKDQCAQYVASTWSLSYGYESDSDASNACRSDNPTTPSGTSWDCTLYTTSCLAFRSALYLQSGSTTGYRYVICSGSLDCSEERAAASQQCGGDDKYTIDEHTCEWTCNDSGDCAEERAAASQQCGGDDKYIITAEETCEWACKDDLCPLERSCYSDTCGGDDKYVIDPATCEGSCLCTDEAASYAAQCGSGNVIWTDRDNCEAHCQDCVNEAAEQCGGANNVEWNQDGDCSYECNRPCEDERSRLEWECGSTYSYWLNEDTCKGCCITDENHDCDDKPDAQDNDDDNDGIPDDQDPCPQNPDPNCKPADTDGDGIPDKDDPDDDGDGIPDDEDPDDDGDGVPDNQDMDHDSDGDGIADWEDPDADWDGDGIPNGEDDDDDGDGEPDDEDPTVQDVDINDYKFKENSYSVGQDTLSQQFSGRWDSFVGGIKQTSFFSIPSQVFSGFDSGSEDSSLIIEGGETFGGDHAVEFSSWTPGLAALRGVLYACFCVLAVRIVTLKR